MIGCDLLIVLNTLNFKKLALEPLEFLPDSLLKIKYFENDKKYVEVLVDIKEFEAGDLIQLKIFNYERFIKVFNIYSSENFKEVEECDCENEGCIDMECPIARMAYTTRHIF